MKLTTNAKHTAVSKELEHENLISLVFATKI